MALEPTMSTPTEGSANAFAVHKKVEMTQQKTWIFGTASADATLPTCTPVGFNETTGYAAVWMAPDPTVLTVNTGGATGGTWKMTVNGLESSDIAFGADADDVVAVIKASFGIKASVALANDIFTISFDADDEVSVLPTVAGNVAALTGGSGASTSTAAGTASYGTHKIKGIVWPEPIDVSDSGEKQGVCMVFGNVDFAELEAVVDSGDVAALTAACKDELLPRGLNVQNLSQVR